MTDPTPTEETRTVTVKGRDLQVRKLADAQGPLLARELLTIRKESVDGFRRAMAAGRVFDILESVVVSEDDREYLMELNLRGDLRLLDMMECLSVWADETQPASKGPVVVRRGRPRRTG
jgi:hypothetical protein